MSYTYTTGLSALPYIYAQARGPQSACGISAMYHIVYVG